MAAPTTEFIKAWCRIDGSEFDAVLPAMIASATASASHETGRDYVAEDMPESVQLWCAANVAYWINNPDAASDRRYDPSPFLPGLLDPHRVYNMESP